MCDDLHGDVHQCYGTSWCMLRRETGKSRAKSVCVPVGCLLPSFILCSGQYVVIPTVQVACTPLTVSLADAFPPPIPISRSISVPAVVEKFWLESIEVRDGGILSG